MQKLTSLFAAVFIGFAVLGLTTPQVRAAPILDVVGGQLIGARNVSVLGALYDVEFIDGTCADVFNGCDNASEDFAFQSLADAEMATRALTEVFIGDFDSDPTLTNGCSSDFECFILTPFEFRVLGDILFPRSGLFQNKNGNQDNEIETITNRQETDNIYDVFAVWERVGDAPIQVPEPATLLLFGVGLLGVAGFRRSR